MAGKTRWEKADSGLCRGRRTQKSPPCKLSRHPTLGHFCLANIAKQQFSSPDRTFSWSDTNDNRLHLPYINCWAYPIIHGTGISNGNGKFARCCTDTTTMAVSFGTSSHKVALSLFLKLRNAPSSRCSSDRTFLTPVESSQVGYIGQTAKKLGSSFGQLASLACFLH